VLGFVRVSSHELNVSLISRHVAACMASSVMITNDTMPAMCIASVYNFSSMLSNFIDRHLVMTKVDLDGCNNYGSAIGWTRWAQIYLKLCIFGGPSSNSSRGMIYLPQ